MFIKLHKNQVRLCREAEVDLSGLVLTAAAVLGDDSRG